MQQDYIVEKVRSAREALMEEFGFDLRALYEMLKEQENESGRKVISFSPKFPRFHAISNLEKRAKLGSRENFEAVLAKVPDVEPPE